MRLQLVAPSTILVAALCSGCPSNSNPTDENGDSSNANGDSDNNGTCVTEIIDPTAGEKTVLHVSLDLDSSGNPHVAYQDWRNFHLKYATRATGSWVSETVDPNSDNGSQASMRLDSAGKVHVSYFVASGSGSLAYATNVSGAWVTEEISSQGGVHALALDHTDGVHVAFAATNASPSPLRYATRNAGSGWTLVDVDTAANCDQPSLAIDSAGHAHVSYFDRTTVTLKYATNATGSWAAQTIDANSHVGALSSLVVDAAGNVHVIYLDSLNTRLKYATNSSGSWVAAPVDGTNNVGGQSTSLVIDVNDKLYASYQDGETKDLWYATRAVGADWEVRILAGGPDNLGAASSLGVDSVRATLHVAFVDQTSGGIYYLQCK